MTEVTEYVLIENNSHPSSWHVAWRSVEEGPCGSSAVEDRRSLPPDGDNLRSNDGDRVVERLLELSSLTHVRRHTHVWVIEEEIDGVTLFGCGRKLSDIFVNGVRRRRRPLFLFADCDWVIKILFRW